MDICLEQWRHNTLLAHSLLLHVDVYIAAYHKFDFNGPYFGGWLSIANSGVPWNFVPYRPSIVRASGIAVYSERIFGTTLRLYDKPDFQEILTKLSADRIQSHAKEFIHTRLTG